MSVNGREASQARMLVSMSTPDAVPTTLYRFFDGAGALLYVGISSIGPVRWLGHQVRDWWPQVATVTTEHFPDRETAADAEVIAIRTEKPAYNVVHAMPPPDRPIPVYRRHGTGSIVMRQDGRWMVSIQENNRRRFMYLRTRVDAELVLAAIVGRDASRAAKAKVLKILGLDPA